jgi:hypothetical protein
MSDQTTEPGTLVNKELLASLEVSEAIPSDINIGGEEQALESHEVIELQTFSERKAWIEDKIKVGIGSRLVQKAHIVCSF